MTRRRNRHDRLRPLSGAKRRRGHRRPHRRNARANGPFVDFYDFCRRVDPSVLNKRAVESLAKAGAFDSLGHPRKGLCLVSEDIIDRALVRRREDEQGISTLFSLLEDDPEDAADGRSPASYDGTWVADP